MNPLRSLLHWTIRRGLAAPRVAHHLQPADLGLDARNLRISTVGGKHLHAWFIPAARAGEAAPVVLVLHGWGGNAAMMLPLAPPLHEAGFASLFIDARCHGASDGDSFASLPRFAEDIEQACAWLRAQNGAAARPIALIGHSVGAGAALLAAARDRQIAAVVSLAAFAHPAGMMRRWLASRRIPLVAAGDYILEYVQRTIGHRFDDIAPQNTIARIGRPVLLVHGLDDKVVPCAEARLIHAARGPTPAELLILPGDHESFADADAHIGRLIDFLRRSTAASADRV